jgi:hypothetical protein
MKQVYLLVGSNTYSEEGECKCKQKARIGFEVLAAVVVEISVLWNITPCSPLAKSKLMFRRNTSPPFSGSKNKPSNKPA